MPEWRFSSHEDRGIFPFSLFLPLKGSLELDPGCAPLKLSPTERLEQAKEWREVFGSSCVAVIVNSKEDTFIKDNL